MISNELRAFIATQHDRLVKKYNGTPKTMTFPFMIKITEEVGELSEEVLKASAMQRSSKLANKEELALEKEIADVLFTTLILAHNLNVDVDTAIEKKMKVISERAD